MLLKATFPIQHRQAFKTWDN